MKILATIGKILFNGWVLSLLGLAFLGAVLWYIGPLVSIAGATPLLSPLSRLIAIGVLVLIWLLITLIVVLTRRRTNAQVLTNIAQADPAPAATPDASAEEVATLRKRFDEAVRSLKKKPLGQTAGRSGRLLYQLPWYVVIGPPGAGKTTLLRNSGLRFPLSDSFGDVAVRGVGGTRNCDWWFTDEAVILDTAGRYTTQDSDQAVDAAAWGGFLSLLKKYRKRRPIDGVIVAFPLSDMLAQTAQDRALHARAVRARILELYEHLQVRVPVYVVLTKADLMNGFVEFFGDLGKEERQQVWGLTFPADQSAQDAAKAFPQMFDRLAGRLDERMIGKLYQERDVTRRGAIQGFPQQVRALRSAIQEFLEEAFGTSQFEDTAMLRGVYLTSGTQEGTPIDRLIGTVSAQFALGREAMPAFAGKGRSYFLTRLLRDLVFTESDLVGSTGFFARNRAWIERGAYAGAAVVTLLMGGLWLNSYLANQRYVDQVEGAIADYDSVSAQLINGDRSVLSARPYLDLLRGLPGGYADTGTPFFAGLGLSQRPKLGGAGARAYERALEAVLLPQVTARLEAQIGAAADQPDLLFEALKRYLMLGVPSRYDRQAVMDWVLADWAAQFPGEANREDREAILGHLRALLTQAFQPPPLKEPLVRTARSHLLQLSQAQRIYNSITWGADQTALPRFDLEAAVGPQAARLFLISGDGAATSLPGLYTREGYEKAVAGPLGQLVDEAAQDAWVLGPDYEAQGQEDKRQLRLQVLDLYARDYERRWQRYLNAISIRRFRDFKDGAAAAQQLAAQNSPLVALVLAIAQDTKLTGARYALPSGQDAPRAPGRAGQVQRAVSRLLDSDTPSVADDPVARVDNAFNPLRKSLEGTGEARTPLSEALRPIDDLYVYLGDLAAEAEAGTAGMGAAQETDRARSLFRSLQRAADQQPDPIRRWLKELVSRSSDLTLQDARGRVNALWSSKVLPFCQQAVAARFPLNPNSTEDMNLADFRAFFGPGGMLDQFFQDNLSEFVDTAVTPWQVKPTGGVRLGISRDALDQFQRAAEIRRLFFTGGSGPTVTFDMKPLFLDRKAAQVQLKINDRTLQYQHGPQRLETVQWPGSGTTSRSQLVFTTLGSGQAVSRTADGPWSWFRLLSQSEIETLSSADRYQISFEAEGLRAVYELRAASLANPFDLDRLTGFRCVDAL